MKSKGGFLERTRGATGEPPQLDWAGNPVSDFGYGGREERIDTVRTGDSRADRILIALRAAGSEGMTRTQILVDVLQRNVSASELNGVLETLRQSGQADFQKEVTGGKPRQRWFAVNS